jgi:hypothetical protein
MNALKENWLTEGLVDFEYKKYVLLAYLQYVRENFDHKKLYPFMSDLIFHFRNLQHIKKHKELLHERFPKVMTSADLHNLQVSYERIVKDDELMQEIEAIVAFGLAKMELSIEAGKEIYESIEHNLEIEPIGVCPLYAREGFVLIAQASSSEVLVYRFAVRMFEEPNENYRGLATEYMETAVRSLVNTYENIKLGLIRRHRQMPNPATYVVSSRIALPLEETLLPIAKRMLVRYVSDAA